MDKFSKIEYKIEVYMEPRYHDSPNKPYFWRLASIDSTNPESEWCTSTAGWANSPEEAFKEANKFYNKYKNIR